MHGRSKADGSSFFLRYLYAVLCAANEVEALRYRIDREGRPVLYDSIDIITPIDASKPDRRRPRYK